MRTSPTLNLQRLKAVAISFLLLASNAFSATPTPLQANWIWLPDADVHGYNQAVVAQRKFTLAKPQQATLRITADSFYRLFINGHWVNDGPARSWPEHFQYDVIDATPYLVDGQNEIRVVARYYGVGDFHRVPKQAGLLAQLDATLARGESVTVLTDGSWEVAAFPALVENTPKVSIQMEPCELYDARQEDRLSFKRAAVLFDTAKGPWQDLSPRDCALLTKQPFAFKSLAGAKVVKADGLNFCVPAARLVNPGLIEANHSASCAFGMATLVEAEAAVTLDFQTDGMNVAIDGQRREREARIQPGRHLLVAFPRDMFGHDKEKDGKPDLGAYEHGLPNGGWESYPPGARGKVGAHEGLQESKPLNR